MIVQAAVIFDQGFKPSQRIYEYKTSIENLQKGDKVVTASKNGLGVASFVSYKPITPIATAWIVQKVDLDSYYKMRKEEENA